MPGLAIRAKADFAAVYSNLATIPIELKQYDTVIAALRAALRLAPDIPEAHANLAQGYRCSGRFREAIAPMRRALELRPDRNGVEASRAARSERRSRTSVLRIGSGRIGGGARGADKPADDNGLAAR